MAAADEFRPLSGITMLLAGLVLALTNFMVVLDTTIANVSVPRISGSLGISPTQGTWIITSYAVAEAICVPLTGWLAGRFGTVRTFAFGMMGFGAFSVLCGLSTSLVMLIGCRIGQGLCGGPLMPLSQTLLLRIFPKRQHSQAMGLWAMTTVTAPIAGPILGGTISDGWSWHWIFFINVPIATACAYGALRLMAPVETVVRKVRIDAVGLALLVLSIGALQIMLDIGREHDWFEDGYVVLLAVIAAVGLAVFIAWEATERDPIVDLHVFRHRGFTVAVITLSASFAVFFATSVLVPQWLQASMGYTATNAGYVTAFTGIGAVVMSPVVARLTGRVDPRLLVFTGILWVAFVSYLRSRWFSGADFWILAFPHILQGIGIPFFFIPLTTIALSAIAPEETASAAGLMSFLRTTAGAVGTSVAATLYANSAIVARSDIVARLNDGPTLEALGTSGVATGVARGLIDQAVTQESFAVAITDLFQLATVMLMAAALLVWLSLRPKRAVDAGAMH